MNDKDRMRRRLELAAEIIPDDIDLHSQIRARVAHNEGAEDRAKMILPIPVERAGRERPAVWQRDRSMQAAVAISLLVLVTGFMLLLNRNTSETPYAAPLATYEPIATRIPTQTPTLEPVTQVGSGRIWEAIWSPDGTVIAMPSSTGVWIFNARDLNQSPSQLYPEVSVSLSDRPLVFSGDSRHLAFIRENTIHLWDLVKGQGITIDFIRPTAIALNTDARIVAIGDETGTIHFYDTQTREQRSDLRVLAQSAPIYDLRFNAVGTELAFRGETTSLTLMADATGEWRNMAYSMRFYDGGSSDTVAPSLSYSPDGLRVAAQVNGAVVIWDIQTQEEIARFEVVRSKGGGVYKGGGRDLVFSTDGRKIATVNSTVIIWDIETGTSYTVPISDRGTVHFNPNLSQMSVVDEAGLVRIFDVTTGIEVKRFNEN